MALGRHIVVFWRSGVVMRAVVRTGPPQGVVETERAFLQSVFAVARDFGWAAYHPHLSKWGAAGWPDLSLVRPPRLMFVELKAERGRTTPAQERWLALLGSCPGVEVHVVRPSELAQLVEWLR
jgi:hypothetical protein